MMKIKNILLGTILTLALVCGAAAAFPAVTSAIAVSNETAKKMREQIYVKTQTMEYTDEDGQNLQVAISSNSDDSRMLVYSNLYGERKYAVIHQDEEGNFEVLDSTLSESDAVKIAEIASESETWREI